MIWYVLSLVGLYRKGFVIIIIIIIIIIIEI